MYRHKSYSDVYTDENGRQIQIVRVKCNSYKDYDYLITQLETSLSNYDGVEYTGLGHASRDIIEIYQALKTQNVGKVLEMRKVINSSSL